MLRSSWAIVALLGVAACGVGESVRLGEVEASTIDLGTCVGGDVVCQRVAVVNGGASPSWPVKGEANPCEPTDSELSWRTDWQKPLALHECGSFGRCETRQVAAAADGTLWLAKLAMMPLEANRSRAGIIVEHYAADGALLGQRVVDTREFEAFSAPE